MLSAMREPRMMMKPKPTRPPPVMVPSSAWVKPYCRPQSTRMPPRTPKPTPAAKIEKKPAHNRRLALLVSLFMTPSTGSCVCTLARTLKPQAYATIAAMSTCLPCKARVLFSYNKEMEAKASFTFLGTGTSVGVPMLGCDCAVCHSTDPRNQRSRCGVLLRLPAGNLLIDTPTELRLQLLREKVRVVHAVVYTHYHADHLFGLDDLRPMPKYLGGPVPLYCTDEDRKSVA